jgi:hypothetical protein
MSGMRRRLRRPRRQHRDGCRTRGGIVKYMILLYGSQRDYDVLAGKPTDDQVAWSAEDVGAMAAFMELWNNDLVESGEFVDAHGLAAPVHTRRIQLQDGVPVVTDGPYPETQEVPTSSARPYGPDTWTS